jgi:peptide deformylase
MEYDNFSLRVEPDPLLYQQLDPFDFTLGHDLSKIESKMIEIMTASGGIGISANQVGFDRQVIVIKPSGHDPFAMFNPEIIESTEEQIDEEGCLSFPNLFLKIVRPNKVKVKYVDKHQKESIIELSGYDAKCLQHEIDHLNGICFVNRVSKLKLDIARKKQRKLNNGRTK